MTWLDIKVWLRECLDKLVGSYIDNVYLLPSGLAIRLRCPDGVYRVLIAEAGRRVSLSRRDVKSVEGDKHVQLWRSLLRDYKIEAIDQIPYERVVILTLRRGSEVRKLVIELLPRGVIAVLDANNRIVLATEYREMKDRVIKPGTMYAPPPSRKWIEELSIEELRKLLEVGKDLVRGLIRGWGLPPELAETVLDEMGMDRGLDPKKLGNEDINTIRRKVIEFVDTVLKSPRPCIVYSDDGTLEGFYPFIPSRAKGKKVEIHESFNDVVDIYFAKLTEEEVARRAVAEIENEIAKLRKTIEDIDRAVESYRRELDRLKRVLEVFEYRYMDIEEVHRCVVDAVKSCGWRCVTDRCKDVVSVDPSRGLFRVSIDGIEMELDVRKRVVDIYSELRKKIADLESSITRSLEEKERIERKISELTEKVELERRKIEIRFSRQREWYEKFNWMITSTGFLVLAGRDASQNIALIKKYAEPHDIVMHADIHGASTVVIKTGGKEIDEQTLREAAVLAACYSKAWKSGYMAIDVFWVPRAQISFSAPSGEYLPKGSYMVYGKKNYIHNVKLELAIGIEVQGNSYRVVIGPENVVAQRAIAYMLLIPGDEDPSRVAKKFVEELAKRDELKAIAYSLDPNEIAIRIPGRSRVVKFVVKKLTPGSNNA